MKKTKNKLPLPTEHTAVNAYRVHHEAVAALLTEAMNRLEALRDEGRSRQIDWADVGSMAHTRELAVQLLWSLGGITSEDAKANHGVIL